MLIQLLAKSFNPAGANKASPGFVFTTRGLGPNVAATWERGRLAHRLPVFLDRRTAGETPALPGIRSLKEISDALRWRGDIP
jgi:hypothetical protein